MLWDCDLSEQNKPRPVRFFVDDAFWAKLATAKAFIQQAPAAYPSRLRPTSIPRRGAALYPYQKVTANLSDGSAVTLSVWVDAKRPDVEAARRSVQGIANARGVDVTHSEMIGLAFATPKTAKETPAAKLARIVKALREGEIDAAIKMAEAV